MILMIPMLLNVVILKEAYQSAAALTLSFVSTAAGGLLWHVFCFAAAFSAVTLLCRLDDHDGYRGDRFPTGSSRNVVTTR